MPPTRSVDAAQAAPLTRAEIRRIVFGLMMAMLLGALDQTIVATALPTIGRDLGDVAHLPWVVTAYLLASTSAVPIYGKLSDIHGSVLCALAPTMPVLVGARLVQGVGGGGLLALAQTIVGDMMTPRERAGWQVYFAAAFSAASLAGPVLGGFFAQHLTWSMIFWINVPLSAAALAMVNGPLRRLPRRERRHAFDLAGAGLLVAATATLLLALSWAGDAFGWAAPPTLGMLAGSGGLFAIFARHLSRTADPLIPLDVLLDKVVLFATAAATLSVGMFLGLAIFAPILFETLRGLTASQSGLAMLPLTVGTVAGSLLAGRAMARFAHYKRLPIAAMLCAIAAALLLAARAEDLPVAAVSVLLAVISVALGTLLPISTVSIQNAVAPHQLGTATATANLCRQLGGAVAVAVFGAVIFGGHGGAAAVNALGSGALAHAFRAIFILVAFGAAGALATMFAMEERPLQGPARAGAEGLSVGG